jgi:cbb3-type cytochrome oxidase maturation protein
MEILYLLIPVSVVLVFLIGIGFWWSIRSGQFDDLEGPAYRILMDDDRPRQAKNGLPEPGDLNPDSRVVSKRDGD